MATTIHSSSPLHAYQTHLYARSLQPELFQSTNSDTVIHDYYTLNIAVTSGAHACTFNAIDGSATELVTDNTLGNPEIGLVETLLCSAEKDFEHQIPRTRINYITAAQTEQLSTNLYNETLNELDEHARKEHAVAHRWKDSRGPCLSMVVTQKYAHQIHIQGYHLIAAESLVLRTQSIFELKN